MVANEDFRVEVILVSLNPDTSEGREEKSMICEETSL